MSWVRKLHFSFYFLDKTMPTAVAQHIEDMRRANPDFEIRVWGPDECRNLIRDKFPQYLSLYDSFPYPIQRSDFSRYAILYEHGGVYADLDYTFTHPLDDILAWIDKMYPEQQAFVNESPNRFLKRRLSNSLMLSREPHCPFWTHAMSKATLGSGTSIHQKVMSSAGPQAVDRTYKSYPGNDAAVLPRKTFNPCSICARGKCQPSSGVLAFHDHAGGWHNKSTRTINTIYCNAWWILGAVLVFAVIVALLVLLAKSMRQCL